MNNRDKAIAVLTQVIQSAHGKNAILEKSEKQATIAVDALIDVELLKDEARDF